MTLAADISEQKLVELSISGNRTAFGILVARYQRLICGIAYNATGSFTQSEDLAQEVFVTAWKKLANLQDAGKLRSWLCGIARNLVSNHLRAAKTEPLARAHGIDVLAETVAAASSPVDRAVSREEETLLWKSLEGIPEIYREPMVLFYRQECSIRDVAEAMDISEDLVKHRLARGREILHEELATLVENTLARSNPGPAFTNGVIMALPGLAVSSKAAALGATAVKGSAGAKAAGVLGLLGALMSPLLLLYGYWIGYRMSVEASQSDRERAFLKRYHAGFFSCLIGFFVLYTGLLFIGRSLEATYPQLFVALVIGIATLYLAAVTWLTVWSIRTRRAIIAEYRVAHPGEKTLRPAWEYRSKWEFLGLPFIHIRLDRGIANQRTAVRAWIAVGERAIGRLFAFGGLAVAPIAIGGATISLIGFGGVSIALFSLGGFSIGIWSFGGLALGWQAFAGCAIALKAAMGGVAIAGEFAAGSIAHAANINSPAVKTYSQATWFFPLCLWISHFGLLVNLIWVAPLMLWRWLVKRSTTNFNNAEPTSV